MTYALSRTRETPTMPAPYERLEELLGRRRIAAITVILESDQVGPVARATIEEEVGRLALGLDRADPPGPDAVWVGKGTSVTWTGQQLTFTTSFRGDMQRDVRGAVAHGSSKLEHFARAFAGVSPVRFAALLLDIEYSSRDLPPVGPWIGSFVVWPVSGEIADGDFRVATKDSERFFLNWTVGTYEKVELLAPVRAGASGQVTFRLTPGPERDRGLRLRVDANTKVNVAEQRGPIEVTADDFARLGTLVIDGVDRAGAVLRGDA